MDRGSEENSCYDHNKKLIQWILENFKSSSEAIMSPKLFTLYLMWFMVRFSNQK